VVATQLCKEVTFVRSLNKEYSNEVLGIQVVVHVIRDAVLWLRQFVWELDLAFRKTLGRLLVSFEAVNATPLRPVEQEAYLADEMHTALYMLEVEEECHIVAKLYDRLEGPAASFEVVLYRKLQA
jgi:hypothetical protein